MTERLLQYIWQLQYFNRNELHTIEGEPLAVIHPGNINHHQGPDFLDAKIKVGTTIWAGNIELHIQSSDWDLHKHSDDRNYGNVILHVVWQENTARRQAFPVLELQSKVSKVLLSKYDELMNAKSFIACDKMISAVPPITWTSWKESLLVQRLQKKTARILEYLAENNQHWEETFWWLIAHNFGLQVNSDAFEKMARSLSLSILAKHKQQVQQTEAMLFGQAGLLENDFSDAYPQLLQKEYNFYRKKYQLRKIGIPVHFLRMRPSNFPTIRLAQLAMLVHHSQHLFSSLKEVIHLKEVKKLLDVTANDYWHYRYTFDEATAYREKKLGSQMLHSIIINTVVPMLFAYGHYHQENKYKEKALRWLEELAAEKNSITNGFAGLGIQNKNAFDSQALIQLKNAYCNEKRCLECMAGAKLLKPQYAITEGR